MHNLHSKWRKPKTKYKSKKTKSHLQRIREIKKQEIQRKENALAAATGRDPRVTSSRANIYSARGSTNIYEIDEFFLIHCSLITEMCKNVACSVCFEKSVRAAITERHGLCIKVVLHCESCESVLSENYSSPRLDTQSNYRAGFVVNRNAVESTNNIGVGFAALQKFYANCKVQTMTSKTFRQHLNSISEEANKLELKVLNEARDAVRKAHTEKDNSLFNKKIIDIATSYDGTWHKRGHTSLYGVGLAIDMLTGLVVDFQVLSKYCHMCATAAAELGADSPEYGIWFEGHKKSDECNINYEGSSGGMEVRAAEIIWSRSVKKK